MHQEYITFFKILGTVSRYSFDSSPISEKGDELRRPFNMTSDIFLKYLYEERAVESAIERKIRTNSEVICLIGPRGCGKSSIGLKVKNNLDQSASFVSFVDVRMEKILEALESGDGGDLNLYLARRVSAEYDRRLFPYKDLAGKNPRVQLYTYLLKPAEEDIKPLTVFYGLQDLENMAARYFNKWKGLWAQDRKGASYYEWLMDTHTSEESVECLINELEKRMLLPHLIYAARFIHGIRRQIIWLDNIDALPDDMQLQAFELLKGFLRTTASYTSCIMSIREENVFKQDDLSDEGGPPYDTRIMMEITRTKGGIATYPAIDIPLIHTDKLEAIFRKRLQFAREYQRETIEKIRIRVSNNQKLMETTSDSDEKSRLEKVIALELQDLSDLLPVISEERFQNILILSQNVTRMMGNERAIFISNNSIRDLLFLHRDFIRNLLASPHSHIEPPEALRYENWYLATLFLSWIRHTQRKYQVGMYDIIADCQLWHNTPKGQIGCLLPHLVLTTIWNHLLKKKNITGKRINNIEVREVVKSLALLGYQRGEIIDCMFFLCYQSGNRNNYLEFKLNKGSKELTASTQVEDDHVVKITYRGKAMVAFVGSSFGYLHECIRFYKNPEADPFAHPAILATHVHAEAMIPYLCDMAQMHFTEFKRIAKTGVLGNSAEFYDQYLIRFGVPQEKPYCRKVMIGMEYYNVRRALQLETIISSLLGYIPGSNETTAKLAKLRDLFMNMMKNINNCGDINFREELSYPPRR